MHRDQGGFTLVELMITLVIFTMVIVAASQIFTGLLTQFKQQSGIAETNIEGIIGLELLRKDLAHVGYGLFWSTAAGMPSYSEAVDETGASWPYTAFSAFNDSPNGVPKAILTGAGGGLNGSDILVLKGISMATNDTAKKSTVISWTSSQNIIRIWGTGGNDLITGEKVIVMRPEIGNAENVLAWQTSIGKLWTTFTPVLTNFPSAMQPSRTPDGRGKNYVVYGVDPDSSLRMPFNRADYYIKRPAAGMPTRCAPNTGILYKGIINHQDGKHTELPLLDCVADIQVDFWLDTDNDGNINWPPDDDISTLTPAQIRDQVKEVRVYIMAHEGQKDVNYDFSMGGSRETLSPQEALVIGASSWSQGVALANLKTVIGNPEYKYYRWKVFTLVVQPDTLR